MAYEAPQLTVLGTLEEMAKPENVRAILAKYTTREAVEPSANTEDDTAQVKDTLENLSTWY